MNYAVQYFYKKGHKEEWKEYKNINEAVIEEDKIMANDKKIRWILIESEKTWRILFAKDFKSNLYK